MILLSQLLSSIAMVLDLIFGFMIFVLIARAIISWVNADPSNPIVRFLASTTDPVMIPLRKKFKFLVQGGMDFTPLALLLVIYFLRSFLVGSLTQYAIRIAHMSAM